MKVRIGVGASGAPMADPGALAGVAEAVVDLGFDSLWLPEILTAPTPDPLVALAWASGRLPRLKVGTTCLLPGRNVLRLAKVLATLDAVSGGRLLLTFVPGIAKEPERSAVGPPPVQRGGVTDEVLPLLRRLWAGEEVTHEGPAGRLEGVRLSPLPVQQPLEPWLGGIAPAALERCGRLADGWLPSLCTPAGAAAGREVIDAAAAAAGRRIDPEHFGVSIGYAHRRLDGRARDAVAARARGADPDELVPVGHGAVAEMIGAFVDVGFSKFVLRPLEPPSDWQAELAALARATVDLQT